jgi:glucokinase
MAANLELVDAARAKNVKISEIGLVGDIGAKNARFALALPDGSVTPTRSYV